MKLVARVREILLDPGAAWARIDGEDPAVASVLTGWLLPLAALSAIASFIGLWLFGAGGFGVSVHYGLVGSLRLALYGLMSLLVMVAISAAIVSALAPIFGGSKSYQRAFALMSYGAAGALVASLAAIVPLLSILGLIGAVYSVWLVYKGLPVMMKSTPGKSVPYLAVIVVASFAVSLLLNLLMGGGGVGPGAGDPTVTISTPAGEIRTTQSGIEGVARKFEDVAKKLESTVRAPIEANADRKPIPAQALKDWLPASVAGLARKRFEVNDGNVVGLGGSSASARYESEEKETRAGGQSRRIDIEVLDAGSASGLLGAFAGLHTGEKETDTMIERSRQVDKRRIVEKEFKDGTRAELTTILANGVMVKAEARGLSLADLAGAVARIDLDRLEAR